MSNLLIEFEDVFSPREGLPTPHAIEHSIDLIPRDALPNAPSYHLSPCEVVEWECQLQQLLYSSHIQPSCSPCASPDFIILKKDSGEWCLVTEYRALNKFTVKNRYPVPHIEDLLDQLHGAQYFTKMDLSTSYHQIRMDTTNTWKTTFKTHFGICEWMVMPFGLTNSPATFMRLINDFIHHMLGHTMVIYLDDILVFSKTWEDHLHHVRAMLQLLRAHKLQVKKRKSSFGENSVSYLGFISDLERVRLDSTKVQALSQWPTP